jgi:hypothetical protein
MKPIVRNCPRRVIDTDHPSDTTSAERLCVRVPYQADTMLFGGWGVRL